MHGVAYMNFPSRLNFTYYKFVAFGSNWRKRLGATDRVQLFTHAANIYRAVRACALFLLPGLITRRHVNLKNRNLGKFKGFYSGNRKSHKKPIQDRHIAGPFSKVEGLAKSKNVTRDL